MKRCVPFLFFVLGAFAEPRQVALRIECHKDVCSHWPETLYVRNGDSVAISSETKWTSCRSFLPEGPSTPANPPAPAKCAPGNGPPENGSQASLTFVSDDKKHSVVVPFQVLSDESRGTTWGPLETVSTLGSLVFAVVTLAMAVLLFRATSSPVAALENAEAGLQNKIGQMKQTAQGIYSTLTFERVRPVPVRQPQASPATSQYLAATTQSFSPQYREPTPYERFMAALDEWCKLVVPVPIEIARTRQTMETRPKSGVSELVQTIVDVAIGTTDTFDPDRRDERQQAALRNLIACAGFKEIDPEQFDAVDSKRHQTVSSQPAPIAQHRRKIAGVVRRGFERDGKILRKADVSVYD